MRVFRKVFFGWICFIFLCVTISTGQQTFTSGSLSITVDDIGTGALVTSITNNGTETLNPSTISDFFTLYIQNTLNNDENTINSESGWNSVIINNLGASGTIEFSNPTNANLPTTLVVTVSINTASEKSQWDLSVTGLGANHTLLDAIFPQLNIKADGNDTFLYPLYSGRLTENPGSGIDYFDDLADNIDNSVGLYPRGWGTTMQFFSYYNSNYGLYFGFHDPDASIKQFRVKDDNNGVLIQCKYPVPNKTIAGNNWNLPGVFELDTYVGNWYEASLIYKTWVSTSSNYWPQDSPERDKRQHAVGDIGVWLTTSDFATLSMAAMRFYIQVAINFFDVPVGMHTYNWYDKDFDHFYPNYFPERDDFPWFNGRIQNENNAFVMPYTNGRLWDTGVGGADPDDPAAVAYYNSEGLPFATKRSDNSVITQTFENNIFAVMCPTQTSWQNVMVEAVDTITRTDQIGSKSIYLDMITASSPVQCMDPSHGHPLGGGSFWRDGYKSMLSGMHNKIPDSVFITTEGGCDFLADEVDAFMIQGWTTDHQVPAWQAIYTGKVQLFGTATGGSQYGNQQFYAKLGQSYIYGVQTGRQFIWLAIGPDATPTKSMASHYVKRLSRMRYKLRNFISYGEMRKPLSLVGDIPELTYRVWDWGGHRSPVDCSYPAVQNSIWQTGDSVIVSLLNATLPDIPNVIDDSLSFLFEFDGSDYGLSGALAVTEIFEDSEGGTYFVPNSFTQKVNLTSITPKAYLIRPASLIGNTYYVSTIGNDANTGTSEALAWRTITHAASNGSPVSSGDIVYVQAGDYGNEHVAFETSGTSSLPILFEGYQTTPGDNPDLNHLFGDALDGAVMPLLDGVNRADTFTAITLYSQQYISIKNFQITNYRAGIDGWNASHITLENIVATSFGNVDSTYSGKGITFSPNSSGEGGDYNKISKCFVENAAAEGFSIVGNYNILDSCRVYCDEDVNNAAMDYYILIAGNNNLVRNCYIERVGNLDHGGHGIGMKGDCENNRVENCTTTNIEYGGFYVRHRGSKYNTFTDCISQDGGFTVRDGASHNMFKNCKTINALSGVAFMDTEEDEGAHYAGRHNKFENCIFRDTRENVIDFFYWDRESICDSNTFVNCVIDGGDFLFNRDRSNANNNIVNSIITNIDNYSRTAQHQGTSYPLNINIDHTNFHNNGFIAPSGTNITIFDPLFVDITNHDFHLQVNSPCINAGTSNQAPKCDVEGKSRLLLSEVDLGIHEYGIHWIGFRGNHWRNAANWSNNQVPTVLDSVTIPPPQFYFNRPEVHEDSEIHSIFLYDDSQMQIKGDVDFEVKE